MVIESVTGNMGNMYVDDWIAKMVELTKPGEVILIDGSEKQQEELYKKACEMGVLVKLDPDKWPGCYYHRSDPNDVARCEERTFICTSGNQDEVGVTNYWMQSKEAYEKLRPLFNGIMENRTMYVIPYLMGPKSSKYSQVGIEITDSIYVALNMLIMTRAGKIALKHLQNKVNFTKGLHSTGHLDRENLYICHFPEDNTIWSINSGYGGNALLGKKCHALRIRSYLAQQNGNELAEHMVIMGIQKPNEEPEYILAAFPSACGKTNLAMLELPQEYKNAGYKTWLIGDDIAWLHIGEDGYLYAQNPEAGFFGVAPGTNWKTNPNAMKSISKNTIFTNVVLTEDGDVSWEGLENPPKNGFDWKGDPWTPDCGRNGAHPNSRFTAPIKQCPTFSEQWNDLNGVKISAIIFGGRRASFAPLVYQAKNWNHGVYVAATMASETTAAATGQTGVVRYDPMAMLPFCGYNMEKYFEHWISIGEKLTHPPKIFHVNWFRKDENGKFIWPGFGENIKVLEWILDMCNCEVEFKEEKIGFIPTNLGGDNYDSLFRITREQHIQEIVSRTEFLVKFNYLPWQILDEHKKFSNI